ncbi:hypothetical protein [Streptomyces sp. NPDC057682]|uniref:hypothetical protein n=1 Tax=Streptomyces sp. NPDC057682 TaxID=3346210 RepID=UPI0036B1BB69
MDATAPPTGLDFGVFLDVRRDQQPHHAARIEAHLRVEATGTGPRDEMPALDVALVLALDVSAARREPAAAALAAALRGLPDGVSFAVLGGADAHGEPARCYPLGDRWALAGTREKRRAAFSAGSVAPASGDRPPPGYRTWLAAARTLFAERPLPLRHLLLITDGSGDDPADHDALRAELDRCAGVFTADVLAVGGDWDPAPLLAVVETLYGDAAHTPDRFAPAVAEAVRRLRRVRSPELPLVVTARPAVRAVELAETAPHAQRLTPVHPPGEPRRTLFPTHRWEPGVRDYLLTVHADASTDPLGELLQLVSVRIADTTAPLVVRWLPPGVAVAAGGGGETLQAMNAATRMRTALDRGYAALDPLSRSEAEQHFGTAVRLATEMGADWVLEVVRKVADIVDGAHGVVRLAPAVDRGTVRRGRLDLATGHRLELSGPAGGTPRPCPDCRRPGGPRARYCIACGRRL